jgi:hypothetical protein
MKFSLWPLALALGVGAVQAQSPAGLLGAFEQQARRDSPAFTGFSAARGERFFTATHGRDWSCASCHSGNPATVGKHASTGKAIEPLAPARNSARFADAAKADKWFRRNCKDVLARECSAAEKGDVLTWLMTLK